MPLVTSGQLLLATYALKIPYSLPRDWTQEQQNWQAVAEWAAALVPLSTITGDRLTVSGSFVVDGSTFFPVLWPADAVQDQIGTSVTLNRVTQTVTFNVDGVFAVTANASCADSIENFSMSIGYTAAYGDAVTFLGTTVEPLEVSQAFIYHAIAGQTLSVTLGTTTASSPVDVQIFIQRLS